MHRPGLPSGVVKQTEPLADSYQPAELVGREAQAQELQDVLTGPRTAHVWLHGPPGTGKTSLAHVVLGLLEARQVRTAYVNCWGAQTFFAVLEAVFQELRALVQERRELAFRVEQIRDIAGKGPLVVALDEVDQMFLKERNATLYNLASLDHATLVCLSQSRQAYHDLDARVRSRLQPHFVECPPYSDDQVASLLRHRADAGLHPATWCEADLAKIASAASGDARIALQTLRTAAYLAERHRLPQIRPEDITAAAQRSHAVRTTYQLRMLSEHHRLLYQLVRDLPGITIGELWRIYGQRAQAACLPAMSRRTFSHYRQYLTRSRHFREEQAAGRRNERRLWVVE